MTSINRAVRRVLDHLGDVQDALDDALSALALEDIPTARACLSRVENGAHHAIEALTHEREE